MRDNEEFHSSLPKMGFGLNKNQARHGGGAMGQSNGPDSTHLQSRLPKPWPRGNQSGDPNQSPTMMVSRMTQQTSTEDDIKYWMGDPDDPDDVGATFNPPYDAPFYGSDYTRFEDSPERLGIRGEYLDSMSESIIRSIVREMICESIEKSALEDLLSEEEEEAIDEFSAIGGGAIAGHTGPLGSDNRSPHLKKKKKKQKQHEPSMRAFGGASEVN